ncbi:hypothetical protein Tsubulata_035113 [Turnera subulata]|uniref:rRNA methyltransferase 1, mitochondrial n=1 Tax=Turnera subulata TaxID=218843 RepID=A0A9Q0FYG1_9ROSI|nr:hypothetical protein Tsubulata_035113 [Turnera subulata]
MYSNLAKTQAFPLATRVCTNPSWFKSFHALKPQALPIKSRPKPSLNPAFSPVFHPKSHKAFNFEIPTTKAVSVETGSVARGRSILGGVRLRSAVQCCLMLGARSFSDLHLESGGGGRRVARVGNSLPWLSTKKVGEGNGLKKVASARSSRSSWEESAMKIEGGAVAQSGSSSWERSARTVTRDSDSHKGRRSKESRNRIGGMVEDREARYGHKRRGDDIVEVDGREEEDVDAVDDPRWDRIKNRLKGMAGTKGRTEKPEFQRWNKQESWGRKTLKEATESTLPKMVGEGVYGVGPVLAALSAARREFYALYVQEGLDLSSNNRKKKDKKGFEKVLRMAEKIGLSTKEISKHDLNMIVDNRPHQGLVLDASPLEMVKIMELDPVLPEEEKGSLWVALDEVTDPQNLGAIIRSAYFFGASGVVLCAKNSAPLSGVVSKASAGSLELMELRYCKNMMQFLVSSAENGWRVIGGSVSSKAVPLNDILPGAPTILVLGSEGTGLRPLVERSCTQLVRIPGNIPVDVTVGGTDDVDAQETNPDWSSREFQSFLAVESLNVSVAAGVLLHHFTGSKNDETCVGDNSAGVLE